MNVLGGQFVNTIIMAKCEKPKVYTGLFSSGHAYLGHKIS